MSYGILFNPVGKEPGNNLFLLLRDALPCKCKTGRSLCAQRQWQTAPCEGVYPVRAARG